MRSASVTSVMALIVCAGVVSMMEIVAIAQTPAPARPTTTYVAPRGADGHPDLQGVWTNNAGTPVERPAVVGDRPLLSDAELAAVQNHAAKLFTGGCDAAFGDSVFTAALGGATTFASTCGETGNYNHFWLADRWFDRRTSLVIDPPDGRIPYTAAARSRLEQTAARRKEHPADGPEDRSLFERCILPIETPNLLAGYNSNFRIVQSREHFVIQRELIHDARIVPLDGRPHVNKAVKQALGDSRGHWEGDTLVVDTTNFSTTSNLRGSGENLHLVERFTRISADTLQYEFTATDPTTWTRPWTARLLLKSTPDSIFEYACHEGNYGLHGILAGARAQENQR